MDLAARVAAALFVVAVAVVAFAGVGDRSEARCPAGSVQDSARHARLIALLRANDEGSQLLRRDRSAAAVCFGNHDEGVVTSAGVVLLPQSGGDAAQAARLGHLLVHRVEGVPLAAPVDPLPCRARVAAALLAEARAHAVELRLRRALGAPGRLFSADVESAFWAAPAHAGTALLHRHLSRGGAGSLADAYARRCRAETAEAASRPR